MGQKSHARYTESSGLSTLGRRISGYLNCAENSAYTIYTFGAALDAVSCTCERTAGHKAAINNEARLGVGTPTQRLARRVDQAAVPDDHAALPRRQHR
jgi:hypothetical protein